MEHITAMVRQFVFLPDDVKTTRSPFEDADAALFIELVLDLHSCRTDITIRAVQSPSYLQQNLDVKPLLFFEIT